MQDEPFNFVSVVNPILFRLCYHSPKGKEKPMENFDKDLLEGYVPRKILSIDLKCFYASVECIDRGLDPFTTPLVVCDTSRGEGTIILAVSPYLKALGIPGRLRKYELPKNIEGIIFAKPRMKRYLEKSAEVTGIYREYVEKEDLHVYSIDESFLDVTNYLESAGKSDVQYAKDIIGEVKKRTGLTVCAGIGENLFMAKVAMDIGAKHRKDLFDKWTRKDIMEKLWPVSPLSKMWGIGSRMEKRLNAMGFFKVGDIACADPHFLSRVFGIKGEELYLHANGIDRSVISKKVTNKPKSLSVGQVLFFDATREEAIQVAREMGRTLARRLQEHRMAMGRMDLCFIASKETSQGYGRYLRFERPLETSKEIEDAISLITVGCPKITVRSIYVVGSELIDTSTIQLDLFTDWKEHNREKRLDETIEKIRKIYGNDAIVRCSSLLKHSTEKARLSQIGGHKA